MSRRAGHRGRTMQDTDTLEAAMSTAVWILVWAVILGTIAFFLVRERRSGRTGPGDFDRTQHEAVRESTVKSQIAGPNGMGQVGP